MEIWATEGTVVETPCLHSHHHLLRAKAALLVLPVPLLSPPCHHTGGSRARVACPQEPTSQQLHPANLPGCPEPGHLGFSEPQAASPVSLLHAHLVFSSRARYYCPPISLPRQPLAQPQHQTHVESQSVLSGLLFGSNKNLFNK